MDEQQLVRILVTGPFVSGKTQLITTAVLSGIGVETEFSPEYEWRYELPYSSITIQIDPALFLQFLDQPGARRVEYPAPEFVNNMLGIIIMVDSRKPETFKEARSIIPRFEQGSVPYIVVANKQDWPDAWTVEDLRHVLRIGDNVPLIPCIATNLESVKNVLLALCDEALKWLDQIELETSRE